MARTGDVVTAAVVLGHGLAALGAAVGLIVLLAALAWLRERDERTKR